jgi:S1-C subfamily serine protease
MRRSLVSCLLVVLALLLLAGAAQAELSAYVLKKVKDAVVLIDVKLTMPDGKTEGFSGSGFVLDEDGQIATNNHVISMTTESESGGGTVTAKSREIQVTFHPGTDQEKSYPATVVRANPDLDLAVIKVDLDTPTFLELADSDAAVETTDVWVVGHPLGLREISFRAGTISARRTWQGHQYLEHTAIAEGGNSGGPLIDQDGRVLGIHSMTLTGSNNMTKFAIPSNVLRDWLATPATADPQPQAPGADIKHLLDQTKLTYTAQASGLFTLAYDNGETVTVHEWNAFFRAYVELGDLPADDADKAGQLALAALHFNYTDPVGRMSVYHDKDKNTLTLFWEVQIPLNKAEANPDYVKSLCLAAANQAARWKKIAAGETPAEPDNLYPGGDEAAQMAALKEALTGSGLTFAVMGEGDKQYYQVSYPDDDVKVNVSMIQGMVWTHAWVGGMPGGDAAGKAAKAIDLLERNWDDSFGRLSLDYDGDILWESQVPNNFLTPDYLAILANNCHDQVVDYKKTYGNIPLNG